MEIKIFRPYSSQLFATITDRYGGVSEKPYDSLNLALHVGDNPKSVIENRVRTAAQYGYIAENLIYMDQTHSANITVIEDCAENRLSNCDAVLTNQSNIPLMVMVADCIPILLYDPIKQAIGAVHAGRNGTFLKILPKSIATMCETYGSGVADIRVYFGPSIKSCCYAVGEEIVAIVKKSFGSKYLTQREDQWYLDIVSMNLDFLEDIGISKRHIEISSICTCCDKDYFSYRREGVTGRFAGIIKLH